ncbi:hypothetical protein CLF_109204 [Clonorchis sinensis]|uniref:Uncharacterized protein n=1 Tax=Clonorchis sinensis TaxID=79923 RepID=G7YSD6_CLOSI|nr:hypothetical protein CLF_109204 [Clonorchis sinensis]
MLDFFTGYAHISGSNWFNFSMPTFILFYELNVFILLALRIESLRSAFDCSEINHTTHHAYGNLVVCAKNLSRAAVKTTGYRVCSAAMRTNTGLKFSSDLRFSQLTIPKTELPCALYRPSRLLIRLLAVLRQRMVVFALVGAHKCVPIRSGITTCDGKLSLVIGKNKIVLDGFIDRPLLENQGKINYKCGRPIVKNGHHVNLADRHTNHKIYGSYK